MQNAPLIVSWPGGIGNPVGERIPTSGGRRKSRRNTRRNSRRSNRKSRRVYGALRKSRRNYRKA